MPDTALPNAPRVVFVVIDSLPPRWLTPTVTPHLWSLAQRGGWHPAGATAVLSAATYPNHASFVTGTEPVAHRVITNRVWDGDRFVKAHHVGPVGATVFDACRAAGRSTGAVVGDHKLIGVMAAHRADRHWPPDGHLPEGAVRDEFRYAADATVLAAIDQTAVLDAQVAVLHLNEPDTACHLYGPDSPEATARFTATDAVLGAIVERLDWDHTVVIVVSDHDQEPVDDSEPVDLAALLVDASAPGLVESDGTAAAVVDGPPLDELEGLDQVIGGRVIDDRINLVWGHPGTVFGSQGYGLQGQHGSPRTARQVAVVSGGHPAAADLAAAVTELRPHATDWAPTLASLVGGELPGATGRALV
ncbi:MAG: alkaline phosphatase family protein [Acidimicrobiia bacterium]|nr:alkaline phosphatase family protein [Acidimicrobiia bacterium]